LNLVHKSEHTGRKQRTLALPCLCFFETLSVMV